MHRPMTIEPITVDWTKFGSFYISIGDICWTISTPPQLFLQDSPTYHQRLRIMNNVNFICKAGVLPRFYYCGLCFIVLFFLFFFFCIYSTDVNSCAVVFLSAFMFIYVLSQLRWQNKIIIIIQSFKWKC